MHSSAPARIRRAAVRWPGLGAVASGVLLLACQPTFKPSGSLSIAGAAFSPTRCRVMTEATGIELAAEDGTRLVLALPPQTLNAFEEIRGAPSVRIAPAKQAERALGTCGSLVLRGEGYHGGGRRAASGHVALACGADASGELDFSGCF